MFFLFSIAEPCKNFSVNLTREFQFPVCNSSWSKLAKVDEYLDFKK